MAKHLVVVRARALHITIQAEFDNDHLAEQWAQRLHHAKVTGAAITIGQVRLPGTEIVRVEHGPEAGNMTVMGEIEHPVPAGKSESV